MARKKEPRKNQSAASGWLVTFSDLVTLLLTFFVLLLSMSTLDRSIILKSFKTISLIDGDVGFMTYKSAARVKTRYRLVAEMLENPLEVLEKQNRIKDLLFPDDVLPPEINRSTLEENLNILIRPEGVSLVLSDKILFPSGKWTLNEQARPILQEIAYLLMTMSSPVNVAGYTDNVPGSIISNYELSGKRAMSVLDLFLTQDLDPNRFSVSAYGPNFPLADNELEEGRAKNRRVEIVIKTGPGAQTYL